MVEKTIGSNNKCLRARIPKSIDLNVHSTSADVIAEKLEYDNILIVTMLDKLSLSTSSGHIKCNSVQEDAVDAKSCMGDISFGNIIDDNIIVKTTSGNMMLSR